MLPSTVADDDLSPDPPAPSAAPDPAPAAAPAPSRWRRWRERLAATWAPASPEIRPAHWLTLAVVLFFAFELRFYNVSEVPDGLFCDEAALGYNAYALGRYGVDENGERLPLYVWSFYGYKNPVYIYSAIAPIRIFGLSRMSLRLTSVLFGTLTVLALFWLGRELWGPTAGLLAAAFLAVTPWHHHFSRVAFELISFPFLFVIGFAFLVRATRRGGWSWVGAAVAFGLCPYAYAISTVIVPAFLGVFVLSCAREIWPRRKGFLLAALLFGLMWIPFVRFQLNRPKTDDYFRNTSWIDDTPTLAAKADRFWSNYKQFYSSSFLFDRGDPLIRHSVNGYGELHRSFRPPILAGLLLLLVPWRRLHLPVLSWAALFPIGASIMNEIPSATRAFIGSPVGPLIAAYAVWRLLALFQRIPRPGWRTAVQAAVLLACLVPVLRDTVRYLEIYHGAYRRESARSFYGFQFGYRETLEYMEAHKAEFPQRLLTANSVNQPDAIVNFYLPPDPHEWHRTKQNGYTVLLPEEFGRYHLDRPTLFAVRPSELHYFADYEVKREIIGPDGVVEFVIIHARRRHEFLTAWSVLGPVAGGGISSPPPRPFEAAPADLPVRWMPMSSPFVALDFNRFFGPYANGNPESCCADAVIYVKPEAGATAAKLEVFGTEDSASFWVNGQPVLGPAMLQRGNLQSAPVALTRGWNEILMRTCETVGDWFVASRLVDAHGRTLKMAQIGDAATLPPGERPPRVRALDARVTPLAETALLDGFAELVRASNQDMSYADYRGTAPGYWAAYGRGPQEVVWRTPPVPSRKPVTFVFTGSSGEDRGRARLSLDGRTVMTFPTGVDSGELAWTDNGVRLQFVPRARAAGYSGYYFLTVPASYLRAGAPLEIAATMVEGGNVSWFMVKARQDTIAAEGLGGR